MVLIRVFESPGTITTFLGFLRGNHKKPPQWQHWCSPTHSSRSPQISTPSFCKTSPPEDSTKNTKNYQEAFSRRMEMAGIKPHHRIAIGVSGGPDSTALCILTSGWKSNALAGVEESSGYIDGLLGIVVDHSLRSESEAEAKHVQEMVSIMGIQCVIACCNWPDGKPKQGHLQEAARNMRYQKFQEICIQHHINVLLIAHHADDQAESFILRLSRNSGILGLAGMAFVSQLFPIQLVNYGESSYLNGILLVRPLLEFRKDDLYKICEGGRQHWVEDPTNQSLLFARNRIRVSLRDISSGSFKSELQAIIFACRKTRSFVDQNCYKLIDQTVAIVSQGYAVVELQKLDPSNVEDLCLSKFVALILQFISQRHRPVRGSVSQLLLSYIRSFPCKGSLTAAGCYLCPAPRSKGTKILVCCSVDSPRPSASGSFYKFHCEEHTLYPPTKIEEIVKIAKSWSDSMVPDASNVPFLHAKSSDSILIEAKKHKIIGESTLCTILSLQREEFKHFNTKEESNSVDDSRHENNFPSAVSCEPVPSVQPYYFMNRFLVTWKLCKRTAENIFSQDTADFIWEFKRGDYYCRSCVVGHGMEVLIRHMEDADWLYLANLSKFQIKAEIQECPNLLIDKNGEAEKEVLCSDYVRSSAQRALQVLKCIPVSARRGLPVLVDSQGLLLSVPSIGFYACPYLSAHAVFKPRVPLGGGFSSYI